MRGAAVRLGEATRLELPNESVESLEVLGVERNADDLVVLGLGIVSLSPPLRRTAGGSGA